MAVPAIPGIYIAALYSGALRYYSVYSFHCSLTRPWVYYPICPKSWLFSGSPFVLTLSSVSSSLNSVATTLWNDLFKNLPWFRKFGERGATNTSKLIGARADSSLTYCHCQLLIPINI